MLLFGQGDDKIPISLKTKGQALLNIWEHVGALPIMPIAARHDQAHLAKIWVIGVAVKVPRARRAQPGTVWAARKIVAVERIGDAGSDRKRFLPTPRATQIATPCRLWHRADELLIEPMNRMIHLTSLLARL